MDSMKSVLALLAANEIVASTGISTLDVDLRKYYVTPGKRDLMATQVVNTTGTASFTTLVTKWMQASSSATADYADITGATFATVSDEDTSTIQTIYFGADPAKPFLRLYNTITGAGAVSVVELFAVKRAA